MAAYGALVSLFNDLELIPNHPIHSFSFDDQQISSLYQTVKFLIDFMESYDSHGCTREAAGVLESKIASAAHAAHDIIGSHVVDQIHVGSSTRGGKVKSYFLLDLHRAIGNMEFVKRKAMQFKAKSGLKAKQPTYSAPSSAPVSLKDDIVGFHEDVEKLVQMLVGEPSNQRLVIPIAGMGGSGKTSLVKIVYEHSFLEHHFDVRLWATISQQYSAETILTKLYGKSTTDGNVSELGEQLYKMLWGRRYLVVLDDMWNKGAWDEVNRFLPDNGNGSRVVVTTRLSDLACHLNSSPYRLNFLNEDKSWELFCRKTFGEEDCPIELEEIGKKIVRRCRRLPLSIVVIGGHLKKFSRAIEHWEKIADLMNPIMSIGEEEQCLEILSLSYEHLPTYLKPCFLYMGIFREDEEISASDLINFWIAEGFLKSKKGLSLEEVGEDYLIDLINMNLILVVQRSWNGKVEFCMIHDTVRELCLKVCKKEKFMYVVEDTTQATSCRERRLVIQEGGKLNFDMIGAKQSTTLLHSLVLKGRDHSFLNKLPADCKLIRVLVYDSITWQKTCLPPTHFQQVNLRALVFDQYRLHDSETAYAILLSISACWNLQTIIMMRNNLVPFKIWEMPQLRHLSGLGIYLSDPVLVEGSKQQECIVLQNLYTLKRVVDLRLTEEVCKRMPNLKNLEVAYHHFYDDYCFHNLGHFNKLKRLKIDFRFDSKWCDDVPSLTFPTSLEELAFITNGHLEWEDLTMMLTSLPHLGLLKLSQVCGSEWNLDEEEFSCLKTLEIWECKDLIYLNANSSNFPVLESLYLWGTPALNEIPLDFGEIPTLQLIRLEDCSASAAFSAMEMVMEQETNGNLGLQLYVSFGIFSHEEFGRFQEMLQEECLTSSSLHLEYYGKKIKTF